MALPDVAALKRVLKIEHTAEDTLVAELLARAIGLVQGGKGGLGVAIEAEEQVFTDDAEGNLARKVGVRSLLVPKTPFDVATIEITDADDTALDNEDLRIDPLSGVIRYKDGSRFFNGPYEITCDVGLDAHPRYAEFEPIVSAAIVDVVSDLYARRNPSAQSETAAGGVSRSYVEGGLPQRVVDSLETIRQNL